MRHSPSLIRALIAAALILAIAPLASAHDVTANANPKIQASFDVLSARAETKGNVVTFAMTTRGGAPKPEATGKFVPCSVYAYYAYAWPAKVDPEAVGFEKGSGILAAAITPHLYFNDEPLFANNGADWHFHWVVLTKDAACGSSGLKVRDIEPDIKPKLPKTWPGAAIFIDSPGYQPRRRLRRPNDSAEGQRRPARTAAMRQQRI